VHRGQFPGIRAALASRATPRRLAARREKPTDGASAVTDRRRTALERIARFLQIDQRSLRPWQELRTGSRGITDARNRIPRETGEDDDRQVTVCGESCLEPERAAKDDRKPDDRERDGEADTREPDVPVPAPVAWVQAAASLLGGVAAAGAGVLGVSLEVFDSPALVDCDFDERESFT